ncbi:MAG: O-antigen ligase family protein [Saprospiraceae bacterium]|nr:O-antigen ligase family protein [Lewinella sp.]
MTKTHLILFFSALYIIGITVSPALLSISMFGLAVAALVHFPDPKSWIPAPDWRSIDQLIHPWRYPVLSVTGVLFLIVLLSGVQGGDLQYWLERLRIKLPLLVIPLMFLMFPRLAGRQVRSLYYLLIILMSFLCLGIGVNYALHAEAINTSIKQGQPMPTPGNHIRFSLILAYTVVCGIYLYQKNFYWKFRWERKLILGLSLFLFLFMHFLSVRSGLLAMYSAILVMSLSYAFNTKKYWIVVGAIALITILPVLAYLLVPSFRAKMEYMSYDRWKHQRNEGGLYADSGRIASLEVGWEIFKLHPLIGVGTGHMQQAVDQTFQTKYPLVPHPLMPHNQLLYAAASWGIIGLAVFLWAFFYPLFYQRNYRRPLILVSYTLFFAMCMLEHNLETTVGIAFYSFFLCLLLQPYYADGHRT